MTNVLFSKFAFVLYLATPSGGSVLPISQAYCRADMIALAVSNTKTSIFPGFMLKMSAFVNFFILLYSILTKIIWRGRRKVVYLQCQCKIRHFRSHPPPFVSVLLYCLNRFTFAKVIQKGGQNKPFSDFVCLLNLP